MPSGRSLRIWSTAFLTSLTASLASVPIVNWAKVLLPPSEAVDWISSTPLIERIAASTFWVIWVSISGGAAPGCEMLTLTAGKSMSGLPFTSNRLNATTPASTRPMNSTMGTIGLRIDHAERFRRFTGSYRSVAALGGLRPHFFARRQETSRPHDDPFRPAQTLDDGNPARGDQTGLDVAPDHLVVGADDIDERALVIGLEGGFGQHRGDHGAAVDFRAGETAGAQLGRIGERDAR